jgi:hypothetical protein
MKKIALLFTLTLVGAGALNGMDPTSLYELRRTGPENPQPELGTFGHLPPELHEKIIQDAIASSNTVEKAIRAINAVSALRGVRYDNLKAFTRLVHILASKFKVPVNIIAEKFATPTAQKYIALSKRLGEAVEEDQVEMVKQLINQGADVNFLFRDYNMLELAVSNQSENSLKILKILLDHGANPYLVAQNTGKSLGQLIDKDEFFDEYSVEEDQSGDYEIKQLVFPQFQTLLKEAMAKHQLYLGEENVSGEGK